jgi:hypothetical protein
MKPSEDLFDLIHSMTHAERKFFKQMAKRYGAESSANASKKYLQFYQAILEQATYDEAALKVKLQDVIAAGNFASWKRHLMEMLEHAIREYHAGKDHAARIHELLRESELLIRRGMWLRSRKKLADCKQLAVQHEDLLSQLRVNEMERRLMLEFNDKDMKTSLAAKIEEWREIATAMQEEQDYVMLFDEVSVLVRSKYNPNDPAVAAETQPYLDHPLLQEGLEPCTFRAARSYYQTRAFLFHLSRQGEAEFAAYQALIAHWDSRPDLAKAHPRLHKLALTNFLQCATKLERLDAFPATLARMAAIPPENTNEAAEDFQTIELNRLLYHYNRHALDAAMVLFPAIEAGLTTYAQKINHARWLSFRINMTLIYFLAERFTYAQRQIDLILDHPKSEHRLDVQALARLWEPILLVARGDQERADTRLHALREWFRTKALVTDFERLVFSHLQAIISSPTGETSTAYQAFAQALQHHRATQGHANGLDELHIWAEARAIGIPMPEFIRRRKGGGA